MAALINAVIDNNNVRNQGRVLLFIFVSIPLGSSSMAEAAWNELYLLNLKGT
jgi:hypothetical protein